ncbi:MAG: hypothetical protein DRH76_10690 [Deltaproteobacteria bacterium]|nr:MAG: hypothetical protein DRH76_10690 [Deltaproteobacteria bacterium]
MNLNPAQQILWDMEVLYKTTMELYENYFTMLEVAIEKTPTTDVARLTELNDLVQEGQEALQHDMDVFNKAIDSDFETITNMDETLKIEELHNKLKK